MKNISQNAFTVDVEEHFHASALASAYPVSGWTGLQSRVEQNTDRILRQLEEHGVKGTFFILGWVADRHPKLARKIADAGHEIASHGFSHQLIYRQTPGEFRDETLRSKQILEDQTGRPIVGYRAATFSITRDSLWALDILGELGFEYDSSVFPVRHPQYGIPDAAIAPGALELSNGNSIVEFPPSVVAFGGLRLPISGGGYFRQLPYSLFAAALRRVLSAKQRPVVFYMHPWEVDPLQPRANVAWVSRWRHYTNLDKFEPRLARLLGEFSFAPMRDVLVGMKLLPARH